LLTNKQLLYIKILEEKSKLNFHGSTTQEMSRFVERANKVIEENKIIKNKLTRENKRFPFPDLSKDIPTKKQWEYIKSLEEQTKLKFRGSTKKDAMVYIDYAKQLLVPLPDEIIQEIDKACSIIPNKNN
jgi:uncharacterized protein YggL (DUF469 family)